MASLRKKERGLFISDEGQGVHYFFPILPKEKNNYASPIYPRT
jgi:hypothetical protein